MDAEKLRDAWRAEEAAAHIHGWDFSHIHGRYEEEEDLPWDYRRIVLSMTKPEDRLLDTHTGGGEFLLSLGRPADRTAATEGYPPNVELCRRTLPPWGIDFRPMGEEDPIPFEDGAFDCVINRHGAFIIPELRRVIRPGGLFISQQVGDDNDRALVELVLPGKANPPSGLNAADQKRAFEAEGFEVLRAEDHFGSIRFFDVGALVWFARIIEWEFRDFSVDACFDRLMEAQARLERDGALEGRTHRYLIVARRK